MNNATKATQRKSIKLKDYDYSQEGGYFITICTENRKMLFGDVIEDKMILNNLGQVVKQTIEETSKIRPNIQIDIYQIMPNHVHMIIVILNRRGVLHTPALRELEGLYQKGEFNSPLQSPSQTIGSIIRGIKSMATGQIRILMNNPQLPIWQRNYFEHVIRDEKDFNMISEYIMNNPLLWDRDRNNPEAKRDLTEY